MGGHRWHVPIAPQARGRVTPRILASLRSAGLTVHQVGQAAYIHTPDSGLHLILGVWDRRDPAPAWSTRLGHVSPGYARRHGRKATDQRWARLARDDRGRFLGLMQWWRWPPVRVYRWDRP